MPSPHSAASSDPAPAHHKINYVEFAASNPQQSCDFFAALFGWQCEPFGPDYIAFHGAGLAGGFTATIRTAVHCQVGR